MNTTLDMTATLERLAAKSSNSVLCLERVLRCDSILANPSRSFSSIHVAGTNGKGTVTTKIAKALSLSGYKTGHFISPHIHTVCERIQINGINIPADELSDLVDIALDLEPNLTFFEILTISALLYFREHKVDFAVIEVGLGGIYDATNIISPKVSVITNISLDHQNILGNTLDEIAFNKAGIIKRGVPVVVGNQAARRPVYDQARLMQAPLTIVPPGESIADDNEKIVQAVLSLLQKEIKIDSCCTDVCLPARFERVELFDGTYIFDMSHNTASIEALIIRLKKEFPYRNFSFIFNICEDKDVQPVASLINSITNRIFLYQLKNKRISAVENLKKYFPHGVSEDFEQFIKGAKIRKDVIVTAGSAYLIDPVKRKLEFKPI